MIKFLVKMLVKFCEKTGNVYHITGGKNKDIYLVRYILFKSKYCCIYIHRFLRSDSDTPHDHPWNFFTYVVSGGYKEVFYDKNKPIIKEKTRLVGGYMEDHEITIRSFKALCTKTVNERKAGSIAYRRATDIHQVVVDKTRKLKDIEQAPLTICLMGPRIREWGFWNKEGTIFTDWRKYLKISPDDPRIVGSE